MRIFPLRFPAALPKMCSVYSVELLCLKCMFRGASLLEKITQGSCSALNVYSKSKASEVNPTADLISIISLSIF